MPSEYREERLVRVLREQIYENIEGVQEIVIVTNAGLVVVFHDSKLADAAGIWCSIENMLLAAEALELGAVWLGQILKNKDEVNNILGLSDNFDLMAVIALGYPLHHNQKSRRKEISELLLKRI